jgi:hypothetical protein
MLLVWHLLLMPSSTQSLLCLARWGMGTDKDKDCGLALDVSAEAQDVTCEAEEMGVMMSCTCDVTSDWLCQVGDDLSSLFGDMLLHALCRCLLRLQTLMAVDAVFSPTISWTKRMAQPVSVLT